MRAEHVLFALLTGFVVVFVAVAWVNTAFYLRLKRYEPQIWKGIGSPMVITNMNAANFAAVREFLRRGQHKVLADRRTAGLGQLVRRLDTVLLAYIALAAAIGGYIFAFVKP